MSLTDEKLPYEILVRYGPDGKVQGAHVQWRRLVVHEGEVLKDEPLPAEPLTVDNEFPTSDVLTKVTEDALARVNELAARNDELEEALDAASREVDGLKADLASASAKVKTQGRAIIDLQRRLDESEERAKLAEAAVRAGRTERAAMRDRQRSSIAGAEQ